MSTTAKDGNMLQMSALFDFDNQNVCTCLQKFFDKHDKDRDGLIDFSEFVKYVTDHEKKLRLYFKKIDTNDDGEWSYCKSR